MSFFKKSPNQWTTWNKGKICQNCNKTDWRLAENYSNNKVSVFYCIHCGMFFAKMNDFPLSELRKIVNAQSKKQKEVKN